MFSELVGAGAIHTLYVLDGSNDRFHIKGRAAEVDYQIRLKRSGSRSFRTLATATELIRGVGVTRIRLHFNELRTDACADRVTGKGLDTAAHAGRPRIQW